MSGRSWKEARFSICTRRRMDCVPPGQLRWCPLALWSVELPCEQRFRVELHMGREVTRVLASMISDLLWDNRVSR